MDTKKVCTIQDISCYGQCSVTVALPVISACGIETPIIPSAVLSTHTGGFTGFTCHDLTDEIPLILHHWEKENITFDGIYTGYIASSKQIDYVKAVIESRLKKNGVCIVDPAMADNGKLYYGFDTAFVESMKKLCTLADYILPNITEASFLTGTEYREEYDREYVISLMKKLHEMGSRVVVLTGVSYNEKTTGVAIYENGEYSYYEHKKLSQSSHGTGDVYASAFTGAVVRGKSTFDSAKIAADFVVSCIENTMGDDTHRYGVKFEPMLPRLIKALDEE